MPQTMNLAAFVQVPTTHHHGAWRSPLNDDQLTSVEFWASIARAVERAGFDLLFMPDILSHPAVSEDGDVVRYGGQGSLCMDPLITIASVIGATRQLGLAATVSTTFTPPYHLARKMATLDHLSGGRAAWNVVTSTQQSEAQNFGMEDLPSRADRYEIADAYMDVCMRLWDAWEPEAFIADRESGIFVDPDRLHPLDFVPGPLGVRGPLTLPRSPQGRPLILQAGSSPRGREFAARWAEVIFCLQRTAEKMKAFRDDMRERADAAGRSPDDIRILPACQVTIGETEAVARERADHMREMIDIRAAIGNLSAHLGTDLSGFPLDGPVAGIDMQENSQGGSLEILLESAASENLTLREAAVRFATSELTPEFVGSGAEVAEQLEAYVRSDCCDGFTITSTYLPGCYEDLARLLTPELRRRGLLGAPAEGARTARQRIGTGTPALRDDALAL